VPTVADSECCVVKATAFLIENITRYKEEMEITALGIHLSDYAIPIYRLKLTLTSPTSGGRSVGIVRSRTKATILLMKETASVKC
jgi:hypothetical protein